MARKDIEEVDIKDMVKTQLPTKPAEARETHLLCGDPGSVQAGLAYFFAGELRSGHLLAPSPLLSIGMRVAKLNGLAERWLEALKLPPGGALGLVEFPQIYTHGPMAGKARTRDVMWVAAASGAIVTAFEPYVRDVVGIEPKDHKGQKEKIAHNDICREVLSPKEKACLGKFLMNNNVMDAVSLGLHYERRIQ